ncbi:MAG: hypothetical protein C0623_06490 [Desulfuromonas sp.]|nr:MAG: hypothetical protein C0623_06490 [Desulfuromonas sp.]
MPIAPPDETLLDLPAMELMDLFGRMRSLTDKAGFSATLPAIWQCSDESQSIKKALFGYTYDCPSFNLGRVGGLLDPTRLSTAAHHGNDLVIIGGSHIGREENDGIGYIRRVHGGVAPCCGMLCRVLSEYLEVYRRATKLIKISQQTEQYTIEVPYKYLFPKPAGETARISISLEKLIGGEALGEGTLGKLYPLNPEIVEKNRQSLAGMNETPTPIGELLTPESFTFSKKVDHESREPQHMLESSIFDFFPEIVTSKRPHRRMCDINSWRQFHRIASYITDSFDGSRRNIFVLAGLTIDHSIRHSTFVPQFGFWMEQGRALEARYFGPGAIQQLILEQKIYSPPSTFLEYAGIDLL